MGIQHTHIVRELTQAQVHILDKDYPGHLYQNTKQTPIIWKH